MSREVLPRVHLYLLPFFLSTFCKASPHVLPGDCLEFDVNELEDYLSKLDLENVPTIDMMIGQFKCPVTALPFGALRSDWARLLLLQKAQPEESIVREKLGRLFRILAIAYFQMEERFDVTRSMSATTSSANALSTYESTARVNSEQGMEESGNSVTDSRKTNEISESFIPSTPRGSGELTDTTKIESTTFTSWNFTGGDGDASDGILNDVSSTTVVSSPVDSGGRIDTAGRATVESFVTASSDAITFSSVSIAKEKSTETSDNYLDNSTVDGGSVQTDVLAPMRTEEGINGDRGINFQKEAQSTIEDSKEDQSTANDFILESTGSRFMKESTVDRFTTDESTTGGFMEEKLGVSEVVTQEDTINDVDEAVELVTHSSNSFSIATSSLVPDTLWSTSTQYQTSTTKDVEEEETKGSTFVSDMRVVTTEVVGNYIKKTAGRGDSPIFYIPVNSGDEEENMVGEEEESKFTTVQFRESIGSTYAEFANTSSPEIPDVKSTTQSSHVHSDDISKNDVAGSTETFGRNRSNHRANDIFQVSKKTSWNLPNSTVYPNKIGKPSISRRPPLDNEFWKNVVASRNVTLAAPATSRSTWKLPDRLKETNGRARGPNKSKKRGSLNTNVEKNFRWFYNFGQEDKEHASGGRQGIHIECNGQGQGDEN